MVLFDLLWINRRLVPFYLYLMFTGVYMGERLTLVVVVFLLSLLSFRLVCNSDVVVGGSC